MIQKREGEAPAELAMLIQNREGEAPAELATHWFGRSLTLPDNPFAG